MQLKLILGACAALAVSGAVQAAGVNFCGEIKNAFGPFDYRERAQNVHSFDLVEGAHYTPEVEAGIRGNTGSIGGDLDYTLRAIPNHTRALGTMARAARQLRSVQLTGAKYPVECYFERAMRFVPNDGAVKGEYANYLFSLGQEDKAFAMFRRALDAEPDNAILNYNVGLAYAKKKDYDRALVHAKKAYALGFPLPGLKNRLIEAGKWNDTPEAPAQPHKPAG